MGASSSGGTADKRRESIKLTPGKLRQVETAIALLTEHYGATLSCWRELTRGQREDVLKNSPQLALLFKLTARAAEVERG